MYGHDHLLGREGTTLNFSINKGVELLLRRRKPATRLISFGKWFLPFTNREFAIYLEIRER
jgi:hypothetical protein